MDGAQILWGSCGYVEYRFPNRLPKNKTLQSISFTVEICSEAANYRENWKSEITLWINEIECGTFLSPGDFGARRGRYTPKIWASGSTQYGLLTCWSVVFLQSVFAAMTLRLREKGADRLSDTKVKESIWF